MSTQIDDQKRTGLFRTFSHQHYYQFSHHEKGWPSPSSIYKCVRCDKQKEFYYPNTPMNPIVPTQWEQYQSEVDKGNAHLVMAPPLSLKVRNIYGDEV
jgi:hypothetical protein